MNPSRGRRALFLFAAVAAIFSGAESSLLSVCGPFTDAAADSFCPFVLEIFTLGITTGTTPTTFEPASNVNRLQMAAFLSRSVDSVLKRGSRRAALDRFWTSQNETVLGLTTVGTNPRLLKSDGSDVWVANGVSNSVSRVRGSDGRLLETWTGATEASGVVVAMGRVVVSGASSPGRLYQIDPSQAAGAVTTVASGLGNASLGIAFDGSRVWIANFGAPAGASVSIATPGATIPWTVTTITTGFGRPWGVLYDSSSIWITDPPANTLLKLDPAGAILQTVTVGANPLFPAFDGTNIWVPNNFSDSISIVRASTGAVLQTLTGNGLTFPWAAAFDGRVVLITNQLGDGVTLWKAADLTPLGSFPTGVDSFPYGAASDGINFWITLGGPGQLARF